MYILNIGMNHRTAPVELRERLASCMDNRGQDILAFLINQEFIKEAFYISTCNRAEALVVTDSDEMAKKSIISYMCNAVDLPTDKIRSFIYVFKNLDAVRHIFRVASSLDSMVVGEPQILGQIKEAYANAVRRKTTGVILNSIMHRAFHVAKRVRAETGICESAVSISSAAVELAEKIFGILNEKTVLLIGAGEMAELTLRHLMAHGVRNIYVANRTFERALELALRFNAHAISFMEIYSHLVEADIVITSTASPDYIITKGSLRGLIRKRKSRPIFFIDISVPRNVEPEVNDLDNMYVYDIDDLKDVVHINMRQRQEEALKAERIIEEEIIKFDRWMKTLDIVPTIISLKNKAEHILEKEFKRSEGKLKDLSREEREAVLRLCRSIAEKLINDPILFLKGKVGRPSLNTYLDFTQRLFNLAEYQEQGEYDEKDARYESNN